MSSFVRKAPPRPWMPPELVGRPGVMSVIEWSGDPDAGMRLLAGLQQELRPAAASLELVPFVQIQRAGDEDFGPGKRSYVKVACAIAAGRSSTQ